MTRPSGMPGRDCPRCPRLVAFRQSWRQSEPDWFNAPVDSFGPSDARLLIVGLAPGLRGANRTGRPFTGDYAGDLLYATLIEFGFARGHYAASADDGLELLDCRITNAVRCVPPDNKPTPQEITTCRDYLKAAIAEMNNLRAVVALGRIAHESFVQASGARRSQFPFAHGRAHVLAAHNLAALTLLDSYHCSRYNTNTGVLTPQMFRDVIGQARQLIDAWPERAFAAKP
jgi:uracil-DNA glycosylase